MLVSKGCNIPDFFAKKSEFSIVNFHFEPEKRGYTGKKKQPSTHTNISTCEHGGEHNTHNSWPNVDFILVFYCPNQLSSPHLSSSRNFFLAKRCNSPTEQVRPRVHSFESTTDSLILFCLKIHIRHCWEYDDVWFLFSTTDFIVDRSKPTLRKQCLGFALGGPACHQCTRAIGA